MARDDDRRAWTVEIDDFDTVDEEARATLLTLGDGIIGTRADSPGDTEGTGVVAAGIYQGAGAEAALAPLPGWNHAPFEGAVVRGRVLDLRDGTLRTELDTPGGEASVLTFASLARPGTAVLVAEGADLEEDRPGPLRLSAAAEHGRDDTRWWARVHGSGGVSVAASERVARTAAARMRLERLVAYATDPRQAPRPEAALEALEAAERLGVENLLAEQRSAWARRWSAADIRIEGDPELQRSVRFCLFHLMGSVADRAEAALGAKGLSGPGYRGHVFWDTDVFVLPFLASTHPPAARALVGYRLQRLDAARAAAARGGFEGARFPWESADTGDEVTPAWLPDASGNLIRILTGEQEEHITADVAWAMARYQAWSGDDRTLGACRELLCETARYWASRVRVDSGGAAHIEGVIGPDEYHESIDDNAFTNVMARWNLRQAAAVGAGTVDEQERRRWLELADVIVDGYDPETGVYEQFAGFHALEPLRIAEIAPRRPVAADVLLGHERVSAAQVLKQADALMLHYLVPDEVAPGSLAPNLDFYEPRTAHGSTLSPGVHAALLARAGRLEQALEMLRLTARIDLDDIGDNTGGGLHLAAMGSVWRALAFGFAGLRPIGDALAIDPVLAPGWEALELRVRFRGSRVLLRIEPTEVRASADPPVSAIDGENRRIQLNRVPRTVQAASTRRSSR